MYMYRLRQICDSTELVKQADPPPAPEPPIDGEQGGVPEAVSQISAEQRQALVEKLTELIVSGGLDECPICMDDILAPVMTPCAHVFCRCALPFSPACPSAPLVLTYSASG